MQAAAFDSEGRSRATVLASAKVQQRREVMDEQRVVSTLRNSYSAALNHKSLLHDTGMGRALMAPLGLGNAEGYIQK